jgi:hypothetical protein
MMSQIEKALFMCAAHCQGGHSEAGVAAAIALGVDFPVRMKNLEKAAIERGYDPDQLWPWLKRVRVGSFAGDGNDCAGTTA